jgi:hypothetical protein
LIINRHSTTAFRIMSSEVNPALVAAIVDQVLSALQGMNIGGSPAAVAPGELPR